VIGVTQLATPAIRVEGLGKRYRLVHGQERARYRTLRESLTELVKSPFKRKGSVEEFWALNDVSFEVQPGEVVGIIGRNGAGKSTLLKILSRITKPTTGRVEINGRVGSLLEVGTGFHPELTGRENIYLNGSILGMSRKEIDRKFDEIVAFAEVEKFLDTPVKRYSSGMYVRLAFAVAAHLEPEILVVDEVLAVGDASFQKKCYEKMRTTAKCGKTVLLVSHQLHSVRDLCKWAVWLERGALRKSDEVGTVIDEYLSETAQQSRPGEWTDLTSSARTGNGDVSFRAVKYHGLRPSDASHSDGPLRVVVNVRTTTDVRDAQIGVYIHDQFGTKLIALNSFHKCQSLHLTPGDSEVHFMIDELHLSPGSYRISLVAGGIEEYYDVVNDACILEVLPSDDSGYELPQATGMVTRSFTYSVHGAA
jgi:lipopolysaccharide transport system ATP-binding protein